MRENERREKGGGGAQHTHTHKRQTRYLYSLAVVDFHYVEVETVNSFARRDEITSFFVKIPPNVY